ncbi:hypothetical protein ONS95_006669 [Cadophora gregata]|uniref:uncharacterized protein n=1 Tax=Cadophora gregata TaxID=51156 RepID=UPI0026DC5FA1|nr:uncharacterized protein ONS95_006669 [Cadophora gregata]KAK0101500.1 hypothetical protein ONS95_006669 [Cadophora gregata]KAK0106488.1 hypothetical protein ONS96_004114 [Cadophora gregata f. sp. sojae]
MASSATSSRTRRPPTHTASVSASVSPDKRICASPTDSAIPRSKELLDVQSILHLPEDAVWGLRKQDLRAYFLKLQEYAINPYPISDAPLVYPSSPPGDPSLHVPPLSPLLRLPLEIRQLIYSYLLPPPCSPPIRGPHPRQLQTHILLTQPIPTCLLTLNRQIRAETIPLLYGTSTQTVHITVDYNLWAHKTQRGELVFSSAITSAIKHVHLSIHLGSEKRNNKPGNVEATARILEVKKGIKKARKWLSGADVHTMKISWQEPPQTYTWEQKRDILDGVRPLRPQIVDVGEINWGLSWNKGKKYRFEVAYLKELERAQQAQNEI